MAPIIPKELNGYRKTLTRKPFPFSCPDCQQPVLPSKFESHCSKNHGVNVRTTCVWCKSVKWRGGQKHKHASHLLNCFRKFMKSVDKVPLLEDDYFDLRPRYLQETLYDYTSLPVENEYDFIWELPVKKIQIEFWDTHNENNLNLAAQYLVQYLETYQTHDWLHVMVKAVVHDAFLNAVTDDLGTTKTLQFSCWCDGGTYDDIIYRQHRHWIVVAPKNHFQTSVWPKVQMAKEDPRPCQNFPCKKFKLVESPMHLVNLMGYLSHRKSKCDFTFKGKQSTPPRLHHFYMYRTLPKCYKLPLVLLWDNGVYELLHQEKFQNVKIKKVVERPMVYVNNQWKQKIRDFYEYESGIVVPVCKRFVPVKNKTTPHYLYLMNGKKLYFENRLEHESLTRDKWFKKQIEGGNCFYDAVGEEFWTPRPRDQKILNYHMPSINKVQELTTHLESIEMEKQAMREKINSLQEENKRLHEENKRLQEENKRLHEEIKRLNEEIIAFLKEENARLKAEMKDMSARFNMEMNRVIRHYTAKLNAKDEEIKSLVDQLNAKDDEIRTLVAQLNAKDEEIKTLVAQLNAKDEVIKSLVDQLHAKDEEIKTLVAQLNAKDAQLKTKDEKIDRLEIENKQLRQVGCINCLSTVYRQ